jgi:hypothetical protein
LENAVTEREKEIICVCFETVSEREIVSERGMTKFKLGSVAVLSSCYDSTIY